MTFDEIDKRFKKSEYEIPEKNSLNWKKELPETYVFNESLSVKENKEKLEKYNKEVSIHNTKIASDYYKNEQKIHMKLLNDVRLAIQQELGVNFELSDKLVYKHLAYSCSIFTCYFDIKDNCKFFKSFMNYAREQTTMEGGMRYGNY